MITDMHVFERGDALLMTFHVRSTAAVRDRLEQFVFSEDVQVEDATETTSRSASTARLRTDGDQALSVRLPLVACRRR